MKSLKLEGSHIVNDHRWKIRKFPALLYDNVIDVIEVQWSPFIYDNKNSLNRIHVGFWSKKL